jgi:hypothetical protein
VEPDSVLFPNRTSQNISALLQQSTEFVNTGVPAYMTWQQLILLQREGMRYDPDLLVLGFVLNDVSEQIDYCCVRRHCMGCVIPTTSGRRDPQGW